MERGEVMTQLATLADQLNPDELVVLVRIAERLGMGQRQYGALEMATDPRDMRREAQEELLDCAVYAAVLCERMTRT